MNALSIAESYIRKLLRLFCNLWHVGVAADFSVIITKKPIL